MFMLTNVTKRIRHKYYCTHNSSDEVLRPVYSDATQLNSTRRRVELSCVAINGPLAQTGNKL